MPVVRVIRRDARQAPAPTPTPTPTPVSDPLEVVSVAQMRQQLRLGASTGDNDPHDPIVTAAIRAGVAFVAKNTTIPLLDESVSCQVEAPSHAGYVTVPVAYIRSITRVKYWTEAQGYRVDPAGEILPASLGRVVFQQDRNAYVYPPTTDGWPDAPCGKPSVG